MRERETDGETEEGREEGKTEQERKKEQGKKKERKKLKLNCPDKYFTSNGQTAAILQETTALNVSIHPAYTCGGGGGGGGGERIYLSW